MLVQSTSGYILDTGFTLYVSLFHITFTMRHSTRALKLDWIQIPRIPNPDPKNLDSGSGSAKHCVVCTKHVRLAWHLVQVVKHLLYAHHISLYMLLAFSTVYLDCWNQCVMWSAPLRSNMIGNLVQRKISNFCIARYFSSIKLDSYPNARHFSSLSHMRLLFLMAWASIR